MPRDAKLEGSDALRRPLRDGGRLLIAVQDFDGIVQLVLDQEAWANGPGEFLTAQESTVSSEGESLLSIELADGV
jgi:hypothetical protein